MNPLGLHALVWTGEWTETSARHAIEQTKAVGFDLIEIPILEPETFDVEMTRQLLADNGLQAACSLGLSRETDVASEDPASVAEGRERLAALERVMRSLDPDTVLKRGYVRVTGPDGRTLTDRVEAAREAVLTLKFRDGDLAVSTGDAPPPPSSPAPRPKPAKKGTAPAQDDLFG